MKINWLLFCLLVLVLACQKGETSETKPQKVYRIVYESRSNEWYKTQAELWKKEIDKNPQNAQAWHNYYNAVRYAHFEDIDSEQKQNKLSGIIEDMGKAIPGTYEFYLLNYWTTHDINDLSLIKKAHEIRPDAAETFYPFIIHNEVKGNKQEKNKWLQKLYESRDISPALLNYNYNVLMSLEPDAILFTNGDNDTYPIWLLQYVHNLRRDVLIINISMAPIDGYLDLKLTDHDLKLELSGLKKSSVEKGAFSRKLFITNLRNKLNSTYPEVPLYYALTVYKPYTENIKSNLYIVGLAQKYSEKRMDNTALVKKNLNNRFRLDYLQYDWYRENMLGRRMISRMNMNYVVPMIMLGEHYTGSGELARAKEWFEFALSIAHQAGNAGAIEEIRSKMSVINKQ